MDSIEGQRMISLVIHLMQTPFCFAKCRFESVDVNTLKGNLTEPYLITILYISNNKNSSSIYFRIYVFKEI